MIETSDNRADAVCNALVDKRGKNDDRGALDLFSIRIARFVAVEDGADDAFVDKNLSGRSGATLLKRRGDQASAEGKRPFLLEMLRANRGLLPGSVDRDEHRVAPAATGSAQESGRALADEGAPEYLERAQHRPLMRLLFAELYRETPRIEQGRRLALRVSRIRARDRARADIYQHSTLLSLLSEKF